MTSVLTESRLLRSWALLGTAWLVAVATVGAWLLRVPAGALQEQLKVLQFWSLEACVTLAIVCAIGIGRELRRELERSDLVSMTMLATLALVLTTTVAPRTHRIFYDEQIYQGIAQNLTDLKRAQMCNDGTVEYGRLQCWSGEYNKQPYAYPHLLGLAYRIVGVRPWVAFVVNAAAVVATVCAVYLLTWRLSGDRGAAQYAGLLMALIPQQLLWSATAAVEPTASLACVLALLAVAQARRSGSTVAWVGAGVLLVLAMQFRPESLLIVGAAAILAWHRPASDDARRLWWVGLVMFVLAATHLAHLVAVRNEGWGASGARLSFAYLMANLRVNGPFYLGDERFPVACTLLAVVGLASSRLHRMRAAMLVYFVAFFGIVLLFYAGSYNYGADVRYSLMTYPPLAVLGGLGASRVSDWLRGQGLVARPRLLVLAVLLFQFLWYAPLVRATTEEAWAARADVRFARTFASTLPKNAYVLTQNPSMFHVWGVNAGQMSLITTNPLHVSYLAMRYAGGIYVHWNYWCNVPDPIQRKYCAAALSRPATLVDEYRERDQRFAFYRLAPPRPTE